VTRPPRVAVLAGGRGARLSPYTSVLPKPLMPIGDRSILEIVVRRLAAQGFTDVTLCVGYLSHLIRAVSEHLEATGAEIRFVHEREAMGTAGPLRLVEGLDETFVAMNGDILTTLDYRALVEHHRRTGNLLTIATQQRTIKIDYGVLHVDAEQDGGRRPIIAFEEKPEIASTVSMGVYVLEPGALDYIPDGAYFDFPDLVQSLLQHDERVGAYVHHGLWFDIGRHDDYEQAVRAWLDNDCGPDVNGAGANDHAPADVGF
jgi:NDP-sugar pyrophosphorylase family protein